MRSSEPALFVLPASGVAAGVRPEHVAAADDGLTGFESEGGPAAVVDRPASASPSRAADVRVSAAQPPQSLPRLRPVTEAGKAVSLADVKSRGVAVEWHQAVAIAQGLCRNLLDTNQATALVTLHSVFIERDGRLAAVGAESRDSAVAVKAVGTILDEMADELPAALRSVVSKAVGAPPLYASVQELSAALAYFERPNRGEILEGVYRACAQLPERAAAPQPAAPAAETAEIKAVHPAPAAPRGRWVVPAAIATALLCGISLLAFGFRSRTAGAEVSSSALPAHAGQASSAAASRPRAAGPNSIAAARTAGVQAPSGRWIRLPKEPLRKGSRGVEQQAVATGGMETPLLMPPVDPAELGSVAWQVDFGAADMAEFGVTSDQATYTAADANVVPPVAVYPKLPTLRPSDRNVSAFEIVVTPAGTVESVKAAEEPESLARAMQMTGILSAAKSWRFQPASRNGHAVRYRLVVLLELH